MKILSVLQHNACTLLFSYCFIHLNKGIKNKKRNWRLKDPLTTSGHYTLHIHTRKTLRQWHPRSIKTIHFSDVGVMASQFSDTPTVCSTTCSANSEENTEAPHCWTFVRGFPSQRTSNADSVSMSSWHAHCLFLRVFLVVNTLSISIVFSCLLGRIWARLRQQCINVVTTLQLIVCTTCLSCNLDIFELGYHV